METELTINEILQNKVTKLSRNLMLPSIMDAEKNKNMGLCNSIQETLGKIINELGRLSSADQNLKRVITSVESLRKPNYVIYLLKNPEGRNGTGEIVGYIKIAHKKLFLHNPNDNYKQVAFDNVLCVLDFFVLPSYGRQGMGKKLFDHMLQDNNTSVYEVAIDGPSVKMEKFMKKHYNWETMILHSNNFAVSPSFFQLLGEQKMSQDTDLAKKSYNDKSPNDQGSSIGRHAAKKPSSSIGAVIHGSEMFGGDANDYVELKANNATTDADHWTEEDIEVTAVENPPLEVQVDSADNALNFPPQLENEHVSEIVSTRPSTLKVEPLSSDILTATSTAQPSSDPSVVETPAGLSEHRDESQLTKKGYFDLKFYHNKLW